MKILNEVILPCIPEPRKQVSKYAPKVFSMQIPTDKIRDVIGSGGKTINKIIEVTGVKIDIEETGKIYISTPDEEAAQKAMKIIDGITGNLTVGEVFEGRVTRLMQFGAFVEFLPGQEGLVHISKMAKFRVERVEDVVSEGDIVKVKFIGYDKMGRIDLSMKDV